MISEGSMAAGKYQAMQLGKSNARPLGSDKVFSNIL
jgi:hypothetical protein